MSDPTPLLSYDGESRKSSPNPASPILDSDEDYERAVLEYDEQYRKGRLHYEKHGSNINPCLDMISTHELHDRRRKEAAERNEMVLARKIPVGMPEQRPWTPDACRKAVSAWDFSKGSDQTVESIDVVERLSFDMGTGKWEGESNRRFWLSELMRIWLDMALMHYGYSAGAWGAGKISGYTIIIHHDPRMEPNPLPDWMPLSCIENKGPWQVALEKTGQEDPVEADCGPELE